MTPEEKNMLERALNLAEENNSLLLKMNRRARAGQVLRVFYWLVILALSFGAYYFIQPYMNQMLGLYNEAQSTLDSVKGTTSTLSGGLNSLGGILK